jgi:tripartite-type tricarboxylate transporter receptor subunit TctC
MSIQTVVASLQHVKSGKLRALANFGATRAKQLPDVPTMKELGYDVEYYLWVGLFTPKGVPADIVKKLGAAIDQAAATEPFKTAIANTGQEYAYQNAADFAKFWEADAKRSDAAVQSIGRVQN